MKKRIHFLLVGLLLVVYCAQAQNEIPSKKGLLADKPKKMNIELKAGRGFLGSMAGEEGGDAKVFYGGASMSYGIILGKNFVGLGAGVEYVDMMMGSFDFPVFVSLCHYFSDEVNKGFYIGAKGGYMFGGKKSIPTVIVMASGDEVNATIDRSMQGPYGEVFAGYCLSGFSLFASYNYRVIKYETTMFPDGVGYYEIPYSSSSRVLHTVMVGISFMLF